jgi:DeoR family glycerol-3-phosphate regulon repressor
MTSDRQQPGLNRRQMEIVDAAEAEGFVSIDGLAAAMGVTPQTIRRDINMLCRLGFLRRYHGGASLPTNTRNLDYRSRQQLMREEKERIGRLVASHIPDGSSLFLNIGTTTEAVARALLGHRGLRVVTNNLNVAIALCDGPEIDITVAGGSLRRQDMAVVGEAAVDFINQFKVDFGIIGISGIDPDGTLLDFDYREVKVAQAIIANARQVFLATDHTKFGRRAMVKVGHVSLLDGLFVDRAPPPALLEVLRQYGVPVHVAPPDA